MSLHALVAASLRRRALVLTATLALLVTGAAVLPGWPVDVLPELTRPSVTVQAEAPGLSASDVERLVVLPLEAQLSGLPGLTRLRSTSRSGLALVVGDFDWDGAVLADRQLVAERLDGLRAPLAGIAELRLAPLGSLMGEVMQIALQAEGETSPTELRTLADTTVKLRLLALPGVAQVTVIGGLPRQYEVRPDPARLLANGVTLNQLVEALRGAGRGAGLGVTSAAGQELSLRVPAAAFDADELAQTAVAWRGNGALRVGQVASLAAGTPTLRGDAGVDGAPAVILSVLKQPGVDSVALSARIDEAMAALAPGLPPDVHSKSVFRQADFIEAALRNLRETLALGALAVCLVALACLRGARALVVTLAVIPVSLLIALLLLKALGLTLNTLTLGGLAIALGELVDDAVVAVENVLRRRRAAPAAPLAALIAQATAEVRAGVLHATLLAVAVLLPLFALPELEGRLFRPLGAAYVAAVLASLLAALTLTPVLAQLLLARARPDEGGERRWLTTLKRRYAAVLRGTLQRPAPLAVVAALTLVLAGVAAWRVPFGFLPMFNESTLTVNLVLPPGISLDASSEVAKAAETLLRALPGVTGISRRTGRAEGDEHAEGVNVSELEVALAPAAAKPQLMAQVRERLALLPAQVQVSRPITHRLDHLLSGVRAPLVVKLCGGERADLRASAREAESLLRGVPGLGAVQSGAVADAVERQVRIDVRRAAEYGVTPGAVQSAIAALFAGLPLGEFVEGVQRVPLVLRLPEDARRAESLEGTLLDTPTGAVPLTWLADIVEAPAPAEIQHEAQQRCLAVTAARGAGSFERAAREAGRALADLKLPPEQTLRIEGVVTTGRAAASRVGLLSLASLGLVIALLYGLYRAWAPVLVVLLGLPFALAGGVLALTLASAPLSLAALIGFVALCGITARNGILKLSRVYQLREEAASSDASEIVVDAALDRLTPVLLTAAIAALALTPLLLDGAAPGRELLHPVALVIFGGLVTGTLFDSLLTPLLCLRCGVAHARPR